MPRNTTLTFYKSLQIALNLQPGINIDIFKKNKLLQYLNHIWTKCINFHIVAICSKNFRVRLHNLRNNCNYLFRNKISLHTKCICTGCSNVYYLFIFKISNMHSCYIFTSDLWGPITLRNISTNILVYWNDTFKFFLNYHTGCVMY